MGASQSTEVSHNRSTIVQTKSGTDKETLVARQIRFFLTTYDLPRFVNHITVSEEEQHSFYEPMVISAKNPSLMDTFYVLVHEQLHHFSRLPSAEAAEAFVNAAFEAFPEIPFDEFKAFEGDPKDNASEHLIVIFNAMAITRSVFERVPTDAFFLDEDSPSPYKNFEKFVIENWEAIYRFLSSHSMVWEFRLPFREW